MSENLLDMPAAGADIMPTALGTGTDLNLTAGNHLILTLINGTDLQVSVDTDGIRKALFDALVGPYNGDCPIQYGTSRDMPSSSNAKIYIKYED